jgi:hypothetical protein
MGCLAAARVHQSCPALGHGVRLIATELAIPRARSLLEDRVGNGVGGVVVHRNAGQHVPAAAGVVRITESVMRTVPLWSLLTKKMALP